METAESLNAERNTWILAEAVHVATLLNKIGITPTALKGLAYLLTSIYPSAGDRYLADIDLLIPKDQILPAVTYLREHGFLEKHDDRFAWFRHHAPGMHRAGRPAVEIHWQVGLGVCNRLMPASQLLVNAQPICIGGAQFLTPSASDLVTHLILHSQLAHPYQERIFPSLRALHDLSSLQSHFGNQISWDKVAERFSGAHQLATLALHLKATQEAIGFEIPISELTRSPRLQQVLTAVESNIFMKIRWYRRRLLNETPRLRFVDPIFISMAVFSRRLRLIQQLIRQPAAWPLVVGSLVRRDFYRNILTR